MARVRFVRRVTGAGQGDSEARVRENLHQTLSKKFVALSQATPPPPGC